MIETAKGIIETVEAFWSLFWSVSFLMGLILLVYSVLTYIRAISMRSTMVMQKSQIKFSAYRSFLASTFLFALPMMLSIGRGTLLGGGGTDPMNLSYNPGSGLSSDAQTYMQAMIYVLMAIGLYSGLRAGWRLYKGEGWGFFRSYLFAIGLIYIEDFSKMLVGSFGGGGPLEGVVNTVFGS